MAQARNKTIYDLVKQLLVAKPALRDSDKKLCWAVWMHLGHADGTAMTLSSFLNPKCPPIESITRARRKVQQNHPHLQATAETQKARKYIEHYKGNSVYFEEIYE